MKSPSPILLAGLFALLSLFSLGCLGPPAEPAEEKPPGANPVLAFGGGLLNSTVGTNLPAIDALLPYDTDIAPGDSLEIDGYWRLDANKKLFRIDRGRTIADQDYPNFPVMVRRGMVVIKEIAPTVDGYEAVDLLSGGRPVYMRLHADGSLLLEVDTIGPNLKLRMVRSDLGSPVGNPR